MSRFEAGMEGMVDTYIYESTSLLEQLDQIMMRAESNGDFDEEDINEIFRIMHTIKGSSAMMGLTNMSTLAHRIEDMFFIIREDKPIIESKQTLFELIFASSDLLKNEIDMLQDEDSEPTDFSEQIAKIEKYVEYLKGLTGAAPAADAEASAEAAAADSADTPASGSADGNDGFYKVRVFFEDNCEMENMRAFMILEKIREFCTELKTIPNEPEKNSSAAKEIVENGFVIMFKTLENDHKLVMYEIESAPNVKSYEIEAEPGAAHENAEGSSEEAPKADEAPKAEAKSESKAETKPAPAAAAPAASPQAINQQLGQQKAANNNNAAHAAKGKQSLISVNLNKLDQLLDMVGEIVIAEAMVASNPDLKGLKLDNFNKSTRELRKLTDELQDIVMSIRMVPLSGVFNKMTRIVRDMKVKLNKDVDLVFEGEETEVDKSVIDSLNDPLMHMVRNSMDHGIEDNAEDRIKRGKPAKGTITLAAYNSSGEVIIVVSDDGGGINTKRVLEKATENGLLTKPAEEYTDKEIFNMVMLPGFSTNKEVTEYSGRGVGMDVVRQSIEKIGGSVSVDSKEGEGTNFIIKIPLSLAIIDGIEVSVGKSVFTIPTNSIKKFIKLKPNQLFYDTSQNELIKDGNKCYPLIRLHQFYNITPDSDNIYDGVVVLVESEGRSACILVDELIGEQQVVVKPFSPMLNRYNIKQQGMAGCTILGDGSITIILDIGSIINEN